MSTIGVDGESIAVILSIAIALAVCAVGFSLLLAIALARAATRGDADLKYLRTRRSLAGRRGPLPLRDVRGPAVTRGPSVAIAGLDYATRHTTRQGYAEERQSYAGLARARATVAHTRSATTFADTSASAMPSASRGKRRAHSLTAPRAA